VPWQEAAIRKFNEATGAAAELVPGEQSATDRLAIYNQQLGAQSPDNDVYQIDIIWPGIVAQHAVDLNASLSELATLHFPALVENNTVNGALVGMPWYTDAGLLYYRSDLLEEYGFENPPETWAELEEQAQAIQDGESGDNASFRGFVWQGNAYEGLTCDALEWQYSNGGGRIIEPDGTVTVNNPQAIAAFERARARGPHFSLPPGCSVDGSSDPQVQRSNRGRRRARPRRTERHRPPGYLQPATRRSVP
jgi:trehalose/maltose transport system substrate-binding protein